MNQDNSIPFEDLGLLYFPAVIYTRFGVQVGGVPSQNGIFCVLDPKKYMFFALVSPQVNIFLFSHWDLIDYV